MSLALAIVARDAEDSIARAIQSSASLVDAAYVLDTGSNDQTREVSQALGAEVYQREWAGFADARTAVLHLTLQHRWTLMLDADMTIVHHPGLKAWLERDEDPACDAWNVEVRDHGLSYRLPWLTRGGREWRYEGPTHSYLVGGGKRRSLLGLTIDHHGSYSLEKLAADIQLLAPGVEAGDPRAVYYTGWALKALGRVDEAAAAFDRRAEMGGWEEEAWHAQYFAALLRRDVEGLLAAHRRRPWRHEPLTHAARIVSEGDAGDDMLFLERWA